MSNEHYKAIDYINDALSVTNQRLVQKPDYPLYIMAKNQLEYVKAILIGTKTDKSVLHSMNLGTLASKEFDTTDPELAQHLSYANYITTQIAAGLKVILPHQEDPEFIKRQKRYKNRIC